MKTKTFLLACPFFLFSGFFCMADKVPDEKARQVALNTYLERSSGAITRDEISLNEPLEFLENGQLLYYIFNVKGNRGFIIVSGDDRIVPVLGYTFSGEYLPDKIPAEAFVWFIDHVTEQIIYVLDQKLPASSETEKLWTDLSDPGYRSTKQTAGVDPMIQTTWDQGCYYNEDCPDDASATNYCLHALTGCGATAMAQVIRYWRSPLHGIGTHSYFHSVYGDLSANFGAATYQYSSMPVGLTTQNPEVAQLIYHCGIAQEMNFGPVISTSYSTDIDVALRTFFDYNTAVNWKWKASYSSAQWVSLVTGELELGRPLIYYGNDNGLDGHFFVCDGYQGTDFLHFNWGWGGYLDGFFYTDDLTPGTNSFNDNQGAIFNIIPNQPPSPADIVMDFEAVPDFSLTFNPWSVNDVDKSTTYGITDYTFPHALEPMAFICFNPSQVTPSMSSDAEIQPHSGSRFGACFSATTPPNNDWFISPQVQLGQGGELSFWVKSYTGEYGLERYKVGVSTTGTGPADFTFISGSSYLEAPVQWTQQTYDLSQYNNQAVYIAIQCVSNDAFIFMIDDLKIKPEGQGGLPSYMTLDFEGLANFTTNFAPWTVDDVNGGQTYNIQNVSFPHNGEAFAYICFNPGQTTPPLTNMTAHSGSKLGACFSSYPPANPNNKWLISPQIQFGNNPAISLWVQSYSDEYGLERFNIGVSATGVDPDDFMIVNTGGADTAPIAWTEKSYNLSAFANQAVYVGIQCVSDDVFIFMIDDIEISGNVAIETPGTERSVTVFPNPARDRIFINFNGNRSSGMQIKLINTLGQTIYTETFPGSSAEIPVTGFPAGLYSLMLTNEQDSSIIKITIID